MGSEKRSTWPILRSLTLGFTLYPNIRPQCGPFEFVRTPLMIAVFYRSRGPFYLFIPFLGFLNNPFLRLYPVFRVFSHLSGFSLPIKILSTAGFEVGGSQLPSATMSEKRSTWPSLRSQTLRFTLYPTRWTSLESICAHIPHPRANISS